MCGARIERCATTGGQSDVSIHNRSQLDWVPGGTPDAVPIPRESDSDNRGRWGPGLLAYTASKHAVIGMTRTAAIELACNGVRVNVVCPAPIETRMGEQLDRGFNPQNPKAAHEQFVRQIPMARYGKPEEVAGLVAYLCSADASYINGGVYSVDGGAIS